MSCLQGPCVFLDQLPALWQAQKVAGGLPGLMGKANMQETVLRMRGWPPTGSRAELRLTDPCGEVPTGPCRLSPQPHLQGGRRGKKALEC